MVHSFLKQYCVSNCRIGSFSRFCPSIGKPENSRCEQSSTTCESVCRNASPDVAILSIHSSCGLQIMNGYNQQNHESNEQQCTDEPTQAANEWIGLRS